MSENREIRCAIELREDESRRSPGRIVGKLLEYGEKIIHDQGPEVFESRSLQWGAAGVVLYDTHDETPRVPVSIVHPKQGDTAARIDARLPDSAAGRKLANSVRSGDIKGLSIEFKPAAETRSGGLRRSARHG